VFDQSAFNQQAIDYARKHQVNDDTPLGVYNLKLVAEDGNTGIGNHVIQIGGHPFTTNSEGRIRVIDTEYMNENNEAYKRRRDYENTIVSNIIISDDSAHTLIGGTKEQCMQLLSAGGGNGAIKVPGLVGSDIAVDAMPSHIRFLDPTGSPYAKALAKLRVIVNELGIVLDETAGKLKESGAGIKEITQANNSGN
jgi:hypothetical protein